MTEGVGDLEDLEHAEVAVSGDSVSIRYPRCEVRESLTRCRQPVRGDWGPPEIHFTVYEEGEDG